MEKDTHLTNRELILDAFRNMKRGRRGAMWAPHKPLLLLLALKRIRSGEPRLMEFEEVELVLRDLMATLREEGWKPNPNYPFWRLRKDEIWEVEPSEELERSENESGDVSSKHLRAVGARAGLKKMVDQALRADRSLLAEVEELLLGLLEPPEVRGVVKRKVDSMF